MVTAKIEKVNFQVTLNSEGHTIIASALFIFSENNFCASVGFSVWDKRSSKMGKLNSFKSKPLYKLIFQKNTMQKHNLSPVRIRISTLPKIKPEYFVDSLTQTKKISFYVQGNRKSIKGKKWNHDLLPGGGRKISPKPMRDLAMSTDFNDDIYLPGYEN